VSLDDAVLAARRCASQQSFYRLLPSRSLADGVVASIVPSSPDRSLFNAVTYLAPPLPPLADLARLYAEAGVRAWTVWIHPGDDDLARDLAAAGHRLDATPEAMAAELESLALDGPDVGGPGSWRDVVATNAAAYGLPPAELAVMELAGDGMRLYSAAEGAVVLAIHEHDGDAYVIYVAARPEARGRGTVAALMRQALRDSLARGCTTTTLEATKLGRPVYGRLGYRSLGTLQMWERRTPRAIG
jgi:ribosomal protein S18 acetylase RimI-like enzyme